MHIYVQLVKSVTFSWGGGKETFLIYVSVVMDTLMFLFLKCADPSIFKLPLEMHDMDFRLDFKWPEMTPFAS